MPFLRVEHYAALASPSAVVVSDIHNGEPTHSAGATPEISDKIGHVSCLAGLVQHCLLSVDDYANGNTVAVAHEGVGAPDGDATYGA